jgi:hypothetical protein
MLNIKKKLALKYLNQSILFLAHVISSKYKYIYPVLGRELRNTELINLVNSLKKKKK